MATFEELKEKYPLCNHAPDPNCRYCHGEGEKPRRLVVGLTPCMCIFVDHDLVEKAQDIMNETIRKIKGDLNE